MNQLGTPEPEKHAFVEKVSKVWIPDNATIAGVSTRIGRSDLAFLKDDKVSDCLKD
jgi:hypothetical protein